MNLLQRMIQSEIPPGRGGSLGIHPELSRSLLQIHGLPAHGAEPAGALAHPVKGLAALEGHLQRKKRAPKTCEFGHAACAVQWMK